MKYTATPGIVQTKICGQTVLIPTRAAYDRCKSVQILPLLWAGTYSSICSGAPIDQILAVHRIFKRKKTDEEILAEIEDFCEKLCAKGFLIRTECLPLKGKADRTAVDEASPVSRPASPIVGAHTHAPDPSSPVSRPASPVVGAHTHAPDPSSPVSRPASPAVGAHTHAPDPSSPVSNTPSDAHGAGGIQNSRSEEPTP